MPLVKETVDRLMKGYDIRLRPDFGGNDEKKNPKCLVCRPPETQCLFKKGKEI